MVCRIEITTRIPDTRAKVYLKRLKKGEPHITAVEVVDVYSLDKNFSSLSLSKITSMLVNPVVQQARINKPWSPEKFSWAIEVGFLPGVTDNIGSTSREMIEDLLKVKFNGTESVYSSQLIFLTGIISYNSAQKIADSLYNPVIQRVHIKSTSRFKKDIGMGRMVPRVSLHEQKFADIINLEISDEELISLGKAGVSNKDGTRRGPLALSLDYMKAIQSHFRKLTRQPTDVEIESIAQTWSEHCKHTIFADPIDEITEGLFKTYIKKATEKIRQQNKKKDFCVSIFTDNSGAIDFTDDYLITHKVETHNSPSALDPFGGAITGIVGVNRDAIGFGLGAKPVANTYGFCFADPNDNNILYRDSKLTQQMLPPRRILDGVVAGVNSGGNCTGIPTPQGFLYFDDRYKGKPLVFVGTLGLIPKQKNGKKLFIKRAKPDDLIVMIGGKVGLDGIHGATFSSESLSSGSPSTAVQIGDPITQKKLSDALIKEARDQNLYTSITDNGAGGLSCSVAEMAKEAGGAWVELEKVPLKYPGLAPWQIWISESQERMTLAVPLSKWKTFNNIMKKHGVDATVIGKFTAQKKCTVTYKGKKVMDVDMEFLHNGLPKKQQQTTFTPQSFQNPNLPQTKLLNRELFTLLERPSLASFEFISMQFDHEVQGTSVIKPLQGRGRVNGETTVVRPLLSSSKGVILSQGYFPSYSDFDTYHMTAASIDTAIRNVVAAGANPDAVALLDNFCWCSSTEPERLGQLKRAAQACFDLATIYKAPFVSGKDSMFNDFKGFTKNGKPIKISIPPTLLVSAFSVVHDINKTISIDSKMADDLLYIVGDTEDELGGSEYFRMLADREHSIKWGEVVPHVDPEKNIKVYKAFHKAVRSGFVASAISVGRGGLAAALVKMGLAGGLGLIVSLNHLPGKWTRGDFGLFSESAGRILITIAPQKKTRFETLFDKLPHALIGKINADLKITVLNKKQEKIIDIVLQEAEKAYKKTFKGF